MSVPALVALTPRTRDQHGHFTLAQAAQDGVSSATITRLRRAHVVVRVYARVYRLTTVPDSDEGRAVAAALAAGGVVSHSWAAWLHGSKRIERTRLPEVTVQGSSRVRIAGVIVHRTTELDSCDRTTVGCVPVTSGARTTIDVAGRLSVGDRMAMTDEMICARKATRSWMYRRARHLAVGRGGVETVVWITHPNAEGEFWSWLERQFHGGVVRAHGFPVPDYNVALRDEQGFIGYADARWQGGRQELVVEVEGPRFHRMPSQRRRDARRGNRYALSGRIALRFTYQDITGAPARVAAELRRGLLRSGVLAARA